MSCSREGVCQITNSLMARKDFSVFALLLPSYLDCGIPELIGMSNLSGLPFSAILGSCGIELVSLAIGSLLSKGSLGLAEGEAAVLTFLQ